MSHFLTKKQIEASLLSTNSDKKVIKATQAARRAALAMHLDEVLGVDAARLINHLARIALGETYSLGPDGEQRPPSTADQIRAGEILLSYQFGKPRQSVELEAEVAGPRTINPDLLTEEELRKLEELAFKASTIDATPK